MYDIIVIALAVAFVSHNFVNAFTKRDTFSFMVSFAAIIYTCLQVYGVYNLPTLKVTSSELEVGIGAGLATAVVVRAMIYADDKRAGANA